MGRCLEPHMWGATRASRSNQIPRVRPTLPTQTTPSELNLPCPPSNLSAVCDLRHRLAVRSRVAMLCGVSSPTVMPRALTCNLAPRLHHGEELSFRVLRPISPTRGAAGTLSRKSVRTVRRSLISDARKLWHSCWRRCRKVQRSLFRKVPSSWTPDIHSRSTIQSRSQQHLRKPLRYARRYALRLTPATLVAVSGRSWASALSSDSPTFVCDHRSERGAAVNIAAPAIVPSIPSFVMIGPPS